MAGINFLVYNFHYLELYPQYLCTYKDSIDRVSCKPKEFCKDPNLLSWEIDMQDTRSLNNWV